MGCVSQAVFFRKEDEKLLRKLLKKVRGKPNPNGKELTRFTLTSHGACPVCMQVKLQADQTDEQERKFSMQEANALHKIIDTYDVSEKDMSKLIEWRHHSFH